MRYSDGVPVESARLLELRRLVDANPGSPAFAELAELYRRAARFDEAITCCRLGLAQHPTLSTARLVLARALLGGGHRAEAEAEFAAVVAGAPSNVSARREWEALGASRPGTHDGDAGEAWQGPQVRVVDLDSLLAGLGAEGRQPPPLMDRLTSGWRPVDVPNDMGQGTPLSESDGLARLESALRSWELRGSRTGGRSTLAVLERWLAAIERQRSTRST
ncbi:MAG: hypothetical protein ACT4QD_13030 [Acidobacteriota bacterium]